MPTPKGKRGQSRGATRMREQGYKLVQLWLDKNERALIEAAAKKARKPLATWIREQAFRAAETVDHSSVKGGR